MCYMRRKNEGGVGAPRKSEDTNFWKPNGQSRNLNLDGFTRLVKIMFEKYAASRCAIHDVKKSVVL